MKSFFVSSTFRDMQEERDMIHRIVFPAVCNKLKRYGEAAEEVDLRWGVDTLNLSEEESGHMVIRVCIDAIDRCVPYFIVLLGERYGWIPESNVLEHMQDNRLEKIGKDISITEMEIRYGTLDRELEPEHCIFCFRNSEFLSKIPEGFRKDYMPESEVHKAKLDKLKRRIRDIKGANILEYDADWDDQNQKVCGLDSFAENLEGMLMTLLMRDGLSEEILCEEEQITQKAWFTMHRQIQNYVSRGKLEGMVPIVFVRKKHQWFTGEPGSGKTSFLSFVANQSIEKGKNVLLYYGGNPGCENIDLFLRWLQYELEKACGKKLRDPAYDRRLGLKGIRDLSKYLKEDIVVFVDAVDQMSEDTAWTLMQLAANVKNIQFFVTSAKRLEEYHIKDTEEVFVARRVEKLTEAEWNLMVDKTAGRRGKKLDVKVMKTLRDKEIMKLPLHLSLALQRLFMMDGEEFVQAERLAPGMDGISQYMQHLLETMGDTPEELIASVVNKALDSFALNGKEYAAKEVLGYLACAPEGLSIRMLTELCEGITMLQVQRLMFFLYDMFEETKEGRWIYKHPLLKQYVRGLFSVETLNTFEEVLYAKCMKWEECKWSERITLAQRIEKPEFGEVLEQALREGALGDEQLWNVDKAYLIKLAENSKLESYRQCLIKGIAKFEIGLSEEMVAFIEGLEEEMLPPESQFYLWEARNNINKAKEQYARAAEDMDKQYQVYCKVEPLSKEIIWEMAETCFVGACAYDAEIAKKWQERLEAVGADFAKNVKDTHYYLLLNENQVWAWKLLKYHEDSSEENLAALKEFFDSIYSTCKVQDNLNLFEQENPGFNVVNLKSMTRYSRVLADIYLRKKAYPSAFPYVKIRYEEAKKRYQMKRSFDTAGNFVDGCVQMLKCVKAEYKEKYYKEAMQVLEWQEMQYSCPTVYVDTHYVQEIYAEAKKDPKVWQAAIQTAKKLVDAVPGATYEEWVLWDYRKHKDVLMESYEHLHLGEILSDLEQIGAYAKKLYECTKDEYFVSILFHYAFDMMDSCMMQEMFDMAEGYLHMAETYVKCPYIQNGKTWWHLECRLVMNAVTLYYRMGEKEKWSIYLNRAEELFANEAEKNKSKDRANRVVLWRERIEYMKLRRLWEEAHDVAGTRPKVMAYLERVSQVLDENELRPGRLLMGQIEQAAGNLESSREYFEMVCRREGKYMPWKMDLLLDEYQIWQYFMAATALIAVYEDTKKSKDISEATHSLLNILAATRESNPKYRKSVGLLLAEIFVKYKDVLEMNRRERTAETLLKWMKSLSEERDLTKEELGLTAECFLYRKECAPIWTEEEDELRKWLDVQIQKWPEESFWKPVICQNTLKTALTYCLEDNYAQAGHLLELIEREKETAVLYELCRMKTDTGGKMSEQCVQYMEEIANSVSNTKNLSMLSRCLYLELLIQASEESKEQGEQFCRRAVKLLENHIMEKNCKFRILWKKDYALRLRCITYSEKDKSSDLYLEDIKGARQAYAYYSGDEKEEIIKLLEWNGKIINICEGRDPKEVANWRRGTVNILTRCLIKKKLLTKAELEACAEYYKRLLEKVRTQKAIDSLYAALLEELPYETFTELYDQTEDTKWLEELYKALEDYREYLGYVTNERSSYATEKIAESYMYDMDIYWIQLSHHQKEDTIKALVETGRRWMQQIPSYYEELRKKAAVALKEFDELLEGKSLELKILIQQFELGNRGNSNEISWHLNEIYEKYGSDLDSDKVRELLEEKIKAGEHLF